jgi:hypothetical protein
MEKVKKFSNIKCDVDQNIQRLAVLFVLQSEIFS